MRFLNLKTIVLLLMSTFIIGLIITACEQQEMAELHTVSPEEQEILNFLESQGMHEHDVRFEGDYVLYEEDAGWDKAYLLQAARGEIIDDMPFDPNPDITADLEEEIESRQQGITALFRGNAVREFIVDDIDFFIDPSLQADCGFAWVTATLGAVNAWNNIAFCRVNLNRVFSAGAADIIIGSDVAAIMPASHTNIPGVGRGDFSSNGRPGRWISINDNADGQPSKQQIMMHEIGHNLGYRHTGTNNGEHIHTTPVNPTFSIMNPGGQPLPATFTTSDQRAIKMYYPSSLSRPSSFSVTRVGGGRVRLTYTNPSNTTRPYFWIRATRFNNAGNPIGTRTIRAEVDNQGRHTFDWSAVGIGNNRFEVRGINLRRDVFSSASNRVTAN